MEDRSSALTFGQLVKSLREERGKTQEELARAVKIDGSEVSKSAISSWEKGLRKPKDAKAIYSLAVAFGFGKGSREHEKLLDVWRATPIPKSHKGGPQVRPSPVPGDNDVASETPPAPDAQTSPAANTTTPKWARLEQRDYQSEIPIARLLAPREEVLSCLMKQIEEGQQIQEAPIKTKSDLEMARNRREDWLSYTNVLLQQLFASPEPARFAVHLPVQVPVLPQVFPLRYRVRDFRQDMGYNVDRLQRLVRHLDLMPE